MFDRLDELPRFQKPVAFQTSFAGNIGWKNSMSNCGGEAAFPFCGNDYQEEVLEMRKRISEALAVAFMMVLLLTLAAQREASAKNYQDGNRAHIIKEVRHELVTLPYYGVFDWLEFEVGPDNTVVLRGQVVRPTTKSDAQARVREIEGVKGVVNEIEVLPLSSIDDRLRRALYRAIYGSNSPLFRYATQTVPSIHIIVNKGRAILKGVVATKGDSNLAYIRARGVAGLFEVKNELKAESEMPR